MVNLVPQDLIRNLFVSSSLGVEKWEEQFEEVAQPEDNSAPILICSYLLHISEKPQCFVQNIIILGQMSNMLEEFKVSTKSHN